jgi:alpha-glucosidase
LRVEIIRPDVVRFAISRGGLFDDAATPAVCVDYLSCACEAEFEPTPEVVRLRTPALVVSLWLDPFRLDVHRRDGTPVVETAADDEGRCWAYATLNDAFVVRRRCRPEDAMYGLGEKTGRLNRRGRDFTLWNNDVLQPVTAREFTAGRPPGEPRADQASTEYDPYYVSIPFFYHRAYPSGAMAGSFVDNGYRGRYDFTRPNEYGFHFGGGHYVEYVFAGPEMPAILGAYTWLTGRMELPPMWSLGYHQCRWFKYTQAQVEGIAQRFRQLAIPCDGIWLDIDFMDRYRVFTWDAKAFPDVPGMLRRLTEGGFKVVTIVDPGIKYEPGYWVFDQARHQDLLCKTECGDIYIGQVWPGATAFPDFVKPETREWWAGLNGAHVRSGLGGIWNDMNEPATGTIDAHAMRFGENRQSHARYHNLYALMMSMATRAGLLDAQPGRRPFVLSRAGSAGIQRYAANWTGDNLSRWDHLWLATPMANGFGVSGQPFVGADVGGFAGDCNAELFVRWVQYAALTPFCRNHTQRGTVDQYPWTWGEVVERLVAGAIRMRYRLMPYLYTAFVHAVETGAPVQRPLVFEYQYDAAVADIDDQFLVGSDLLVAPVYRPGTTARQVYLPTGTWYEWFELSEGTRLGGPGFVVAPTPMKAIPVYARGGAVVPLWPEAPLTTAGYYPVEIQLHLFVPAADGAYHSQLDEDDGLTMAALDGRRYRTSFELVREGRRLTLTGTVEGDGFPEFARERFRLFVHGAQPASVQLGRESVSVTAGRGEWPNAGTGFSLWFEV